HDFARELLGRFDEAALRRFWRRGGRGAGHGAVFVARERAVGRTRAAIVQRRDARPLLLRRRADATAERPGADESGEGDARDGDEVLDERHASLVAQEPSITRAKTRDSDVRRRHEGSVVSFASLE